MRQTLRPYATAGVVIAGAGLIAATPVAAPLAALPVLRDVALTAGDATDLMAPWAAVQTTATENLQTLINNYYLAPGVAFQQIAVNMAEFAQQLKDDPSSIATVSQQMQTNLDAVLSGWALHNPTAETLDTVTNHTLTNGGDLGAGVIGHAPLVTQLMPMFLPPDQAETMIPLLNMMSSPMSGILIGSLGPMISPMVALYNSISDGDGFNETLANMFGASLNGATLNLDFLLPMIMDSGALPFPEGVELTHLDFAFGGLLSTGTVGVGPYETLGPGGAVVDSVPAVGGSLFNSVGLGIDINGILPGLPVLEVESQAIGPIGALMGWGQTVGALLGSGWDGKGPIPVTPPGAGLELPVPPALDDGGIGSAAAEADFTGFLQDLAGSLDAA